MDKLATIVLLLTGILIGVAISGIFNLYTNTHGLTPSPTAVSTGVPSIAPTVKPTPTPTPTPTADPVVKTIQWGGHTWQVTDDHQGVFTSKNVWVDQDGMLHMKLIYDNGVWKPFNLKLLDKVGYGTFKWTIANSVDYIQDVQNGGNAYFVFCPFLYDNTLPDQSYGEIDIEMCKWGNPNSASNTDWSILPADRKVQYNHFSGSGNTYTLEWVPDHIKFSVEGPDQPYKEYIFDNKAQIPPETGHMQVIIYIGEWKNVAPQGGLKHYEAEVILSGYKEIPYSQS